MIDFGKLFKKTKNNSIGSGILTEYNEHRPLGPQKYLCYAPFKSIYFGHHGKAVACCYNRNYILGEYPHSSVKEIWQGEKANQLREFIKNNDLSLGCYSCKQQIVAGNYDGVKAKQYDQLKMNSNQYPSVMEFELSNLCNLECEMCSGDFSSLIRAKREKLPPLEIPYDDAFVEQLEEFIPHLEEVKFYGGEPFLIELYYRIWEKIAKINPKVRISVQTNATVLNNRVKEILQSTNFHLNISLDSLIKTSYEKIRKNADYDLVMENIKYFRSYTREKDTFFGISACAMQQNWKELPEFIKFCNTLNAPVYFHTVFYPLSSSIHGMAPVEIQNVSEYLLQFDFPENNPVEKKNRTHYFDFIKQIKAWRKDANKEVLKNKIKSFRELSEHLADHINTDPLLTPTVKNQKIERIRTRVAELERKLEPELVAKIFAESEGRDVMNPDNMIFYLDKLPISALVVMARSAVK